MAPSGQAPRRRIMAKWTFGLVAIAAAFISTGVLALDESQSGVVDWHHKWIGTPHLSTASKTVRGSGSVFVATDKHVVASVRSKSGELAWRQVLDQHDPIHQIRAHAGHVVALTGADEFHARLYDGKSGQILWDFAPPNEGTIPGASFGQAITTTSADSNLIVLNEGAHVRKLFAKAGIEAWHWASDLGSSTTYFQVLEAKGFGNHQNVIYVFGLNRGVASFSLEIVALDSNTGEYIKTFHVKSSILGVEDLLTVGGGSTEKPGFVAWLEDDNLKVLTVGTDRITKLEKSYIVDVQGFVELVSKLEIVDLALPEGNNMFLLKGTVGEYNDATSAVLVEINEKTGVADTTFDFGERSGFSVYTATAKPGSEEVVILRAYKEDTDTAILELVDVTKHETMSQTEIVLPYQTFAHFTFAHLELFDKGQGMQRRIYYSTADGSFHGNSEIETECWHREESLAYTRDVEFVDLPERKLWTQDADETGHATADTNVTLVGRYLQRLSSHMTQLKSLPAFVVSYANPSSLFTKAPVAVPYSEVNIANQTIAPLYRDQFGLRKILVFSTSKGKLVAVDSANKGQIIWSRYFPWGHDIKHTILIRQAHVRMPPVLAMIAQTVDGGANKMVRMYRLNALTGEEYESESYQFPSSAWIPAGYLKAFKLNMEDPEERTQVLALVDERMHITTFPSTDPVQEAFRDTSEDIYFMLNNEIGAKVLNGYKPIISADMERMDVEPAWSIPFPEGEEIAAIGERPAYEVMASLGRVLGDRGVLYKYQNPNYATVITVNKASAAPYMTVYLVDVVKGSILYQATHENIGLAQPILATQYENNVVYTFWSEGETSTSARGFQAVALELYESQARNERTKSDTFSSYVSARPHVIGQSFPFPHAATAIGVTSTKAGISGKDILFGLSRQSVLSVNKRYLDPRRPTSAPTKMEKEEQLLPYSALTDDPRLFLSYDLEVAGISKISTAPTLLESTTVVVAYGHDLFVTRHAPSKTFDILNADFSKSQLLLTIVILIGMLAVFGPMVEKKMLRELWY